ncbi:MAG: TatD family hydrolase, partial [Treponema sp.]|nr:TatD family hydrolase [Treponema sp.]
MLTDAHCHPADLAGFYSRLPGCCAEGERRRLGVACASSATSIAEFEFCERLSLKALAESAAPVLPCFAVHPQMPLSGKPGGAEAGLAVLDLLAGQGRLAAVGETGFDLFSPAFRETEKTQDLVFAAHIEAALRHGLPLVLHARRAMHKIFAHAAMLRKCRAVVFHSWPGTASEGQALLRRGINVFFSFGTTIALNHREAMRCCAIFPGERLLTETDAPFQPLRGREFSRHADLPHILETMAALRHDAGKEGSTTGA